MSACKHVLIPGSAYCGLCDRRIAHGVNEPLRKTTILLEYFIRWWRS